MTIADYPGKLSPRAQSCDDVIRETRHCPWEIAPVERHGYAGEFPMAGWSVLAFGSLGGASAPPLDPRARKAGRHPRASGGAGLAEAEPDQIGKMQRPLAASAVGRAARASCRDVPDGVGAEIAIGGNVRGLPDPDSIH